MEPFIVFFNHPFFIIVGGISTISLMLGSLLSVILIVKGIVPVWIRLGSGLIKRKIAVFALDEFTSLRSMLVDSSLFRDKNIVQIHKNDVAKAEEFTFFILHWKDYGESIDQILSLKKDKTALVVYAPQHEGRIDDESLKKINNQRNAVIVNFRGRLLNDIFVSLMTTVQD
jgi:hypothetical protein